MPATASIYHRKRCPFCRRLRAYLAERDLDGFELVDFHPDQLYDELKALNPKAQVPTMVGKDGLALFESSIIMEYLEDASGEGLRPTDPAGRARTRLLYDLADHYFTPAMIGFVRHPADHPTRPGFTDDIVQYAGELEALLDEEGPWALPGGFSLADLSLPPLVYRAIESGFDPGLLPDRVRTWCAAVLERPSMAALYPEVRI